MRSADASPTAELWSTTHAALVAGRWSIARRLLDDLARRSDYVDHLPSLASYVDALKRNDAMTALDRGFAQLLVDRIELVNSRAERNRDEKLQRGRRELGNATPIVAPGQQVRFIAPTHATGTYDILAVRDGLVHVRGVKGTPSEGQHWCARPAELATV